MAQEGFGRLAVAMGEALSSINRPIFDD